METKSFQKLVEKRLEKDEIARIEAEAQLEAKVFRSVQQAISDALTDYMVKNKRSS